MGRWRHGQDRAHMLVDVVPPLLETEAALSPAGNCNTSGCIQGCVMQDAACKKALLVHIWAMA